MAFSETLHLTIARPVKLSSYCIDNAGKEKFQGFFKDKNLGVPLSYGRGGRG
jgi:hypothetical protein